MGYRWKPNKAQKQAYAERMREAEEMFDFVPADGAIRTGDYVVFVGKNDNVIYHGYVTKSTYRSDGQHSFTIGGKVVMGRNIYDRILAHVPHKESISDNFKLGEDERREKLENFSEEHFLEEALIAQKLFVRNNKK